MQEALKPFFDPAVGVGDKRSDLGAERKKGPTVWLSLLNQIDERLTV